MTSVSSIHIFSFPFSGKKTIITVSAWWLVCNRPQGYVDAIVHQWLDVQFHGDERCQITLQTSIRKCHRPRLLIASERFWIRFCESWYVYTGNRVPSKYDRKGSTVHTTVRESRESNSTGARCLFVILTNWPWTFSVLWKHLEIYASNLLAKSVRAHRTHDSGSWSVNPGGEVSSWGSLCRA